LFWIAVVWCVLFTLSSLVFSILGALSGAKWAAMDGQARLMLCLSVFGQWSTVMMAYLSGAAQKVKKGELPMNGSALTGGDEHAGK